jgi:hypothetical protein
MRQRHLWFGELPLPSTTRRCLIRPESEARTTKPTELNSTSQCPHRRSRLATGLRGAAILSATALLLTVALAWLLNRFAFSALAVSGARIALIAALASAAAFGMGLPLIRWKRACREQRIETALPKPGDRPGKPEELSNCENAPALQTPAADRVAHIKECASSKSASAGGLFAWGALGLACLAVLVWIIASGPSYLGYGASLIWTGTKKNVAPLYLNPEVPFSVSSKT